MNFDLLFEGDSFDQLDELIAGMETPETVFEPLNEDAEAEE